jgi:hypothetical protein
MLVAVLFALPVNAVNGYYAKETIFAENFDTRTTVDWDDFETQGVEARYNVAYDALNASWNTGLAESEVTNWSYGIYTQTDIYNATVHSDNDIFVTASSMLDWEVWDGIIDDENIGISGMNISTVGQCGVSFIYNETDFGIKAWYMDTGDELHIRNFTLDLTLRRWYHVENTYMPALKTAILNVTDTVSGDTDSITATHIRIPEGGIRQFFFGYAAALGGELAGGIVPFSPNPIVDVYLADNVDIYAYEFVTTTPAPTPTAPVNYIQPAGEWIAILGGILLVVGLIFYADIVKAASDYNYSAAIGAIPAVTGAILIGAGAYLYYYTPFLLGKFWFWLIAF